MADGADGAVASIPSNARARQLRACLLCGIVQTPADFRQKGCPNCEEVMPMKKSQDAVLACTSPYFDGAVALVSPEASWVARWLRQSKYVRGIYAAQVKGRIPADVEDELKERGIHYRPRDMTSVD